MKEVETIVFDLGGVLVELDGKPIKNQWVTTGQTYEDSWQLWLQSPTVQQFDRGLLTPQDFARNIIEELSLDVSADEFLVWLTDWPKDFFPGSLQLLADLKQRFSLGIFSNITELHWPRYYHTLKQHGSISHYFASYQMGLVKPDPVAFEFVIKSLELDASTILFLDDNQTNVDAAVNAGIQSACVKGVLDARKTLENLGLL